MIVLALREHKDTVARDLLVLKSRGTRHSLKRHRFRITDAGIEVARTTDGGAP